MLFRSPDYWTARWDILEKVKQQFDARGIEIPFAQVDGRIRRADKAGGAGQEAPGVGPM